MTYAYSRSVVQKDLILNTTNKLNQPHHPMNTNYAARPYGVSANRLFTLADALFSDRTPSAETQNWSPPVDLTETEVHYELAAELPGVNGSEVKVLVRDGMLTLTGERTALPAAEGTRIHLTERRSGPFQRRFSLPKDADGEHVSAQFKNGILTITVPKREEVKPREIEVRIG